MKKPNRKVTMLDILDKVLDSDLPVSTRNRIATHYLLPGLGTALAPVQMKESGVGSVDRPSAEDIMIENNPRLKAEYEDTERVMVGKVEDEEDE